MTCLWKEWLQWAQTCIFPYREKHQIPWDNWSSLINNNLSKFWLPYLCQKKKSYISWLLWESVLWAWNPQKFQQTKHHSQLFSLVQFSSVAQSYLTLCDPRNCSTPGFPVHHQLPEPTQTHVHWVGDAIQPSHPLLSPSPPALNLSQHQGLFKWPKYWSFSFNISPSSEHPGLISFRMDRLHLLEVQGTLKSLLQHHSSKASILGCSAFFIVQLSHPYMTTRKTIALTRWTFVGKVMSLFF